ncbi:7263_t:CDS:10 [Entrophospora sp. SA101]|nr:7263_t:CDS:10 [Entrophospora sp. SA101]
MKIKFNNSVSLNKQREIKNYIEEYLEPIALDEIENITLEAFKNIIREKINSFPENKQEEFETQFANADIKKLIGLHNAADYEINENHIYESIKSCKEEIETIKERLSDGHESPETIIQELNILHGKISSYLTGEHGKVCQEKFGLNKEDLAKVEELTKRAVAEEIEKVIETPIQYKVTKKDTLSLNITSEEFNSSREPVINSNKFGLNYDLKSAVPQFSYKKIEQLANDSTLLSREINSCKTMFFDKKNGLEALFDKSQEINIHSDPSKLKELIGEINAAFTNTEKDSFEEKLFETEQINGWREELAIKYNLLTKKEKMNLNSQECQLPTNASFDDLEEKLEEIEREREILIKLTDLKQVYSTREDNNKSVDLQLSIVDEFERFSSRWGGAPPELETRRANTMKNNIKESITDKDLERLKRELGDLETFLENINNTTWEEDESQKNLIINDINNLKKEAIEKLETQEQKIKSQTSAYDNLLDSIQNATDFDALQTLNNQKLTSSLPPQTSILNENNNTPETKHPETTSDNSLFQDKKNNEPKIAPVEYEDREAEKSESENILSGYSSEYASQESASETNSEIETNNETSSMEMSDFDLEEDSETYDPFEKLEELISEYPDYKISEVIKLFLSPTKELASCGKLDEAIISAVEDLIDHLRFRLEHGEEKLPTYDNYVEKEIMLQEELYLAEQKLIDFQDVYNEALIENELNEAELERNDSDNDNESTLETSVDYEASGEFSDTSSISNSSDIYLKFLVDKIAKAGNHKELHDAFQAAKLSNFYSTHKSLIDDTYRRRTFVEYDRFWEVIQMSTDKKALSDLSSQINYLDREVFPEREQLHRAKIQRIAVLNAIERVERKIIEQEEALTRLPLYQRKQILGIDNFKDYITSLPAENLESEAGCLINLITQAKIAAETEKEELALKARQAAEAASRKRELAEIAQTLREENELLMCQESAINVPDKASINVEQDRLIRLIDTATEVSVADIQTLKEEAAINNKCNELINLINIEIAQQQEAERIERERLEREINERSQTESINQNSSSFTTNNDTSSLSSSSEITTFAYSAPDGGDYSGGGTIAAENFSSPKSPSQIIQEILGQAEKAIESKQLPPLENAEKQITSLFEEKDESKKQVYYQHQTELENKLEKQIQNDILQQTKKAAIESVAEDLKIARVIRPDIQPKPEKKQNWKLQTQEAIINNLNSLLGSELKIEDLDNPFSEFSKEVYQKQLTELTAYQQQVAAHIAEKKRNYSQINELNTTNFVAQQETAGTVAGIVALNYWLNSGKTKVGEITHRGMHPNVPNKIKLLVEQYLVDLKKLQKNGYSTELAQKIQESFRQIQALTEQWLAKQKNLFDEKN